MITQVGNDAFGDYIVDQLENAGLTQRASAEPMLPILRLPLSP